MLYLSIFSFVACVSYLRNTAYSQVMKIYAYVFFWKFNGFSSYS